MTENQQCCGNCGIIVGKDPVEGSDFISWNSKLLKVNSITVGDAISKLFKTKFPDGTIENSVMCHECYGVLQDLFSIWHYFVSKTVQSSILYAHLKDGETEDVDLKPLLSEPPQFPAKIRLEARIARRKQNQDKKKPRPQRLKRKISYEETKDSDISCDDNGGNSSSLVKQELDVELQECTDYATQFTESTDVPNHHKTKTKFSNNTKRKTARIPIKKLKEIETTNMPDSSHMGMSTKTDDCPSRHSSKKSKQSSSKTLNFDADLESDHDDWTSESDHGETDFLEDFEKGKIASGNRKKRSVTHDTGDLLKPFVCDECGRKFEKEVGLNMHIAFIHRNVRGPYICDFGNCGKNLKSFGYLKDHMNLHLGVKPYICDQCGWSTTGAALLRRHLRKHLKPEEKDALKNLVCDICGAKFIYSGDLKAHKTVHSNEKPFQCSYKGCQSRFKLRQKLNLHEKEVHLGQTEIWSCKRCGREFNRKHNFKQHMDVHEKYDLTGGKMRKSRDPPVRDTISIKHVDEMQTPSDALPHPRPASGQI